MTSAVKLLLTQRERSYLLRQQLFHQYQLPIITVNVNIPGINKNTKLVKDFFNYVIKPQFLMFLQQEKIVIKEEIQINSCAGPYLILVLNYDFNCKLLKELLVNYELKHNFLQLVDFDLYNHNNQKVSRTDLNLPMRKCYLCPNSAKYCARKQTHQLSALLDYVEKMLKSAFHNY